MTFLLLLLSLSLLLQNARDGIFAQSDCTSWLLRLLAPLVAGAAAALGLSLGAWARVGAELSAGLASWGRRSGTDLASLFHSGPFASAFLGLNLLHALLLKAWAVPALQAQGTVGRAAMQPIISFVARSTGKVGAV